VVVVVGCEMCVMLGLCFVFVGERRGNGDLLFNFFYFFEEVGLQGLGRERFRVSADGCFSTVGFFAFVYGLDN
jgi:hypothetical protein